jgi:uncharacterized protein YegL
MSEINNLVIHEARPLPVILLADISGSMYSDNNIGVLNEAVREMIDSLSEEESLRAEVYVAVITFGKGGVQIHIPFNKASEIEWNNVEAGGSTPMGEAFLMAQKLIEDKEIISSRSYAPSIILLSDGKPTDNYKEPLHNLLSSPRAAKAFRMSMSIGDNEGQDVLREFMGDTNLPIFQANEARQIRKFFKFVTMSVSQRIQSVNPNNIENNSFTMDDFETIDDLDDFEF